MSHCVRCFVVLCEARTCYQWLPTAHYLYTEKTPICPVELISFTVFVVHVHFSVITWCIRITVHESVVLTKHSKSKLCPTSQSHGRQYIFWIKFDIDISVLCISCYTHLQNWHIFCVCFSFSTLSQSISPSLFPSIYCRFVVFQFQFQFIYCFQTQLFPVFFFAEMLNIFILGANVNIKVTW